MKCEWCHHSVDHLHPVKYPHQQLEMVCDDCYDAYNEGLPKCIICGRHTISDKTCYNCGGVMCFNCHDEFGLYCSEDCQQEDKFWARVDYEYDRRMDR